MTVKLLVLFLTPLLSGLLIYLVPKSKGSNYRLLLVFAGQLNYARRLFARRPGELKCS